ncbi:MAG: ester cyclase [Bacteroidota bacterium]
MREIVEKYVSIWNSNCISDLEEVFSEKSKYWDATQEGNTVDVLTVSIAATHEAFSDVLFQIISLSTASENQFFLEWQMTGTNTGEFFGFPPTGKRIEIYGLDFIRFESHKIDEIKSFYDSSLFSQQLELQ